MKPHIRARRIERRAGGAPSPLALVCRARLDGARLSAVVQPPHERILRFLHAAWGKCYAGSPVLVDSSDENAELLAASLDDAARDTSPALVG